MVFYENTYILHSALQEGRLNDIIGAIENKVKSLGAEILYSDHWGRKKLAYLINKEFNGDLKSNIIAKMSPAPVRCY